MSLPARSKKQSPISMLIASMSIMLVAHPVAAQNSSVGVSALVIKTDFSSSTATVVDTTENTFLVTFHVKNTGDLTSKNTTLSLIIPVGWEYQETSGTVDRVRVQDSYRGLTMELSISPLRKNQEKDVGIILVRKDDKNDEALYAAISSEYSESVHAKLKPESGGKKESFWSSWFTATRQSIWMVMREVWSRFLLAVRYTK